MVDVDRRLPPSHTFALRRLSLRSSRTPTTLSPSPSPALQSFSSLTSSILSVLKFSKIPLSPGLSESELTLIESTLNVSFPPDLRSLLSVSVPSSLSFPNWRSPNYPSLIMFNTSLRGQRSCLKRAPPLIPVSKNCYIPARPCLAGNPVFYVDDARVFCCARNIHHFFADYMFQCCAADDAVPAPLVDKSVRWVEFWSDAASSFVSRRRRSCSSTISSSVCASSEDMDVGPDPEMYVEIRPSMRKSNCWVEKYMDGIGGMLKKGGWKEEEVEEMVHVSEKCWFDWSDHEEDEEEEVMDVLAMRAGRWAEMLRGAGWSDDEVKEVMGEELMKMRRMGRRRKEVVLPPAIRHKVERLAQEVLRY